jgi:hypothetical protein
MDTVPPPSRQGADQKKGGSGSFAIAAIVLAIAVHWVFGVGWTTIAVVIVVMAVAFVAAVAFLSGKTTTATGDDVSSKSPAAGQPGSEVGAEVAHVSASASPVAEPTVHSERPSSGGEPLAASVPSPTVPEGWRTLRWGMSQAEADEVIRKTRLVVTGRKENDDGEPLVNLDLVSVGELSLRPVLRFGPDKLCGITLFCPEEKGTITAYEQLKAHLTREIGLPPFPDDGVDVEGVPLRIRGSVWSLPRTTIEVRFMGNIQKPGNMLSVTYKDPVAIAGPPLSEMLEEPSESPDGG